MGRFWQAIVVVQVAMTAMFVPIAVLLGAQSWGIHTADLGLPAEEYLSVRLGMDEEDRWTAVGEADFQARYEANYRELGRRLETETGVRGVTVARQLPGSAHRSRPVEVDAPEGTGQSTQARRAQVASVDENFFEVMGAAILSGRGFSAHDSRGDGRAVIVNESFAREFMGSPNAVGRRLRYPRPSRPSEADALQEEGLEPWYDIVGVVEDLAFTVDGTGLHEAGVYHPLVPEDAYPLYMAVHVPSGPGAFTGRLRQLAMETAPALRLHQLAPMDQAAAALLVAFQAWFVVIVIVGGLAVLLTNAGIYSIISFTVSRRTREIGVRVALGADRGRIVVAILSRMTRQVSIGVVLGVALGLLAAIGLSQGAWLPTPGIWAVVGVYLVVMTGVCMFACVVPTRRALRIQPTEALAADG